MAEVLLMPLLWWQAAHLAFQGEPRLLSCKADAALRRHGGLSACFVGIMMIHRIRENENQTARPGNE